VDMEEASGPANEAEAASAVVAASMARDEGALSPGSLAFLDSLHTGCTPSSSGKKSKQVVRKLFPQAEDAAPRCLDDAFAETLSAPDCKSLLDSGDTTWQPMGIDTFICGARVRRGRSRGLPLQRHLPRGPVLPLRAAELAARAELRRAPKLFRKVDVSAIEAAAAFDYDSPRSAPAESDDEVAPVAAIPKLGEPMAGIPPFADAFAAF